MYYWDGQTWVSTLSSDGRHRWNGTAWVPVSDQPFVAAPGQAAGGARQPTSWTRPLQYAVAGWYVWSALFSLTLPIWLSGLMTQILNQSIANQVALHPDQAPPPAGFTETMQNAATIGMWIGVGILVAFYAVPFIGALRRWTWIYYVVLVLLGLGALFLPVDLFDAAVGPRTSAASSFTLPSWFYIANFVTGLPGAALFAWMLIALITRGPWAMRRVSY
jgi:hypothetical protein